MVLDFAPKHWTTGTRLVALALADRVNGDSLECWPSVADISRRTGMDRRTVQRHLRQLEAEGVITNQGQRTTKSGAHGSNVWVWNLLITFPQAGQGGGSGAAPGSGNGAAPRGAVMTPPEPEDITTTSNPIIVRLKAVDSVD